MKPSSRAATLALCVAWVAAVTTPANAYSAPGPRWPGSTIRVHSSLPRAYTWSVNKALATWNRSGAKVRFRKVGSASAAQVRIGFGDTSGAAGRATLGYTRDAWVRLAPAPRRSTGRGIDRVATGMILAHELGHVLGLHHTRTGGCRLMEATIQFSCTDALPGYYPCPWLTRDDLKGAVRLYGGRVRKLPRRECPIEPKPPRLTDVRVDGGGDLTTPVSVSWSVPKGVRKGSTVEVGVYQGARCSGEESAYRISGDTVALKRKRWVETGSGFDPGDFCVEVQVVNRWGLGGPTVRVPVTRRPPPVPVPVVGALTEYPDDYSDYSVAASLPPDTSLGVMHGPAGQCPAEWDASTWVYPDEQGDGTWLLSGVPEGAVCLSFFAVSDEGVGSAAVTREVVHGPRPPLTFD